MSNGVEMWDFYYVGERPAGRSVAAEARMAEAI
jgi:hypothetical protein